MLCLRLHNGRISSQYSPPTRLVKNQPDACWNWIEGKVVSSALVGDGNQENTKFNSDGKLVLEV